MKTCSQGQNIETLNSGSVIKDLENMFKKNVLNFRGNDLYPSFGDLNPPFPLHPEIANITVLYSCIDKHTIWLLNTIWIESEDSAK